VRTGRPRSADRKVLQLGDSLVIKTELVHVADGSQLWGQHYNLKLGDIFAVQEEIAKQISEKLQMRLSGEKKSDSPNATLKTPRLINFICKVVTIGTRETNKALRKASSIFRRAIEV